LAAPDAARIGTLAAMRRYPVKSLRGEELVCAEVTPSGIEGDRTSALFVHCGHQRAGNTYRGKEHDRLHLQADAESARQAAIERGVAVEVRTGGRFFDDAPISLLIDGWLDGLAQHLGYRVEWERFRPNFFVHADPGFAAAESDFVGTQLRLGAVRLQVRSPIERCVTITYHPRGERSDPAILEFLARHRNAWMGIYCDVVVPGQVRLGDRLTRL
jgi:uncharacterized protein